ncbi:MAG TPA: hypothetical protein VMM18_10055 [Gemmatimonadaceae bacterium]|nr:hypothetical protein [Gemmatimonadaceae bacterium]
MAAAFVLAIAACGPASAGGAPYPRGMDASADRLVVSRFTHITGVAVTQRWAFVASENGVATFDRMLDRWLPPAGEPEPGPARRVLGVAAHPLDDAVWIVEQSGLVYYQPALGWSLRSTVVGIIDSVMFDRREPRGGIFARASGQWMRVTTTGIAMPVGAAELPPPAARLVPPSLEALVSQRPALRSYARLLTRDAQMRSWEPSAGAEAPDGSEVWLGTWGYGVFRMEPEFLRSVHEPYGLLDRGAGALALATDGVWVAGAGDARAGAVGGLVFASNDLRDWEWQLGRGLEGARARALAVRGRRAWVGTDRGAVRVELGGSPEGRVITAMHGLPADQVLSVAARMDGVWLGTARGVVFVAETRESTTGATPRVEGGAMLSGTPVRALLPIGDTLWIGSDAGLFLLPPRRPVPVRLGGAAAGDARLTRPVHALAHADSVVAVGTRDDVLLVDPRSGAILPTPAAANARAVGGATSLAMDARTLWIGGPSGLLVVDRVTGTSRLFGATRELPGAVHDIAITELFAWVATPEGLVRLRRLGDGSVR